MSAIRRGPWSTAEDEFLLSVVDTAAPLNWVRISNDLGTRSPKQCRERFHQNLKPNLNHDPITPEEGRLIDQLVIDLGKRWAEIARRLKNRSDNAVKNWWNGNQNRRRRSERRRAQEATYRTCNPSSRSYGRNGTANRITPGTANTTRHCPQQQPLPPPMPVTNRLPPIQGSPARQDLPFRPLSQGSLWGMGLGSGSGSNLRLPSPSSSDSTYEVDTASNYTTSPGNRSLTLSQPSAPILPPIRAAGLTPSNPRLPPLPSLNAISQPLPPARNDYSRGPLPRLPPIRGL